MSIRCYLDDQCERIIAQLDCELQWGLGTERQRQYSAAIAALTDPACSGERLRTIVQNYHSDHARLAALRDQTHPQHSPAWEQLQAEIAAVMQKRQLAWSSDRAIDRDDLLQIACIAVAESLQRFRFECRFTTWVARVAVWSVQRTVRDRLAQKRFAYIEALDSAAEADLVAEDRFEEQMEGQILSDQVISMLRGHTNRNIARVFVLRAYCDYKIEDIGHLVDLHPSRVRALLSEARKLLQQHPSIRGWIDNDR